MNPIMIICIFLFVNVLLLYDTSIKQFQKQQYSGIINVSGHLYVILSDS